MIEDSGNLNDAIEYLTESMVIIDRLYNFIMNDGFKEVESKNLSALERSIIQLGENLDLTMEELAKVDNSSRALEVLLKEFEKEVNGRDKDD